MPCAWLYICLIFLLLLLLLFLYVMVISGKKIEFTLKITFPVAGSLSMASSKGCLFRTTLHSATYFSNNLQIYAIAG